MRDLSNGAFPVYRLIELSDVVRGSSPRPGGDPRFFNGSFLPWITVADVTGDDNPILTSTKSHLTEEGSRQTRIFEPGTVLLSNSGATLGVPRIAGIRAGANDGVAGFLNLSADLDAMFLYYCLSAITNFLREEIAPGVGQPNLNTELIGQIRIPMPSLCEQEAIVGVLGNWDRAIRQLTDLVSAKLRFKQGQMQKQFAGNLRFPEFNDRWQSVRLSDVTEECSERNRGRMGLESVMAVTKADGIVPMRERTIGASIDRYLVVQKNCFAYNPMRINIGSIARWQGDKDILVSPDYVVFCCKEQSKDFPGLDSDFLDHFRRSKLWEKFVLATGNGSVRIRIYFSELSRLKLNLPSLAEQTKIAKLLNAMDREIALLRKQLELLKLQKKGLMQKLLTGQVRVKIPKGAK